MEAEKEKHGIFNFKGLAMCFKPSEENYEKEEEENDDSKVKVKRPDTVPELKKGVSNNIGKEVIQEGRIETNLSTTVQYTWFIWNFSKLNCDYIYSDTFFTGKYAWRIILHPRGGMRKNYLSLYLSIGDKSFQPTGSWSKTVNFKLTLKNYYFNPGDIKGEGEYKFGSGVDDAVGFGSFITLSKFHDPHSGFLVNDRCSIAAEVSVENDDHQHPNDNRLVPVVTINDNNNNKKLEENVDLQELLKVE